MAFVVFIGANIISAAFIMVKPRFIFIGYKNAREPRVKIGNVNDILKMQSVPLAFITPRDTNTEPAAEQTHKR